MLNEVKYRMAVKKYQTFFICLLASLLLGASCRKTKAPEPEDQLPPATQTGANTFGCLVNGKVYIPRGSDGTSKPNLRKNYEIFNSKPQLTVITYRVFNSQFDGEIGFGIDSIFTVGNYLSTSTRNKTGIGGPFFNNCGISGFDTTTYRNGIYTITKLDLTNGIISGTFNCTIKPNNCDTIKITDGRFDLKL
jgi:hypothetical protein